MIRIPLFLRLHAAAAAAVALASLVAACGFEEPAPTAQAEPDPTLIAAPPAPDLATGALRTRRPDEVPGIPSIQHQAMCAEVDPAPSFCSWAMASAFVAMVEVEAVSWSDAPAFRVEYLPDGVEIFPLGACDSPWFQYAFAIDVSMLRVLRGEAPEKLRIQISAETLRAWYPRPHPDWDGSRNDWSVVNWYMPEDAPGRIAIDPGMRLVVAATPSTVADGIYTISSYPVAAASDDGSVVVMQENETECSPGWSLPEGTSLDSLARMVAACDVDPAFEQLRDAVQRREESNPFVAWMSVGADCLPPPEYPSSCTTDSECGANMVCVEAVCRDREPDDRLNEPDASTEDAGTAEEAGR